MNYESLTKLSDSHFKRLVGVKRPTFESMSSLLKTAYHEKHNRRGRHSKLSVEDMLFLSLNYLRSYDTFFESFTVSNILFISISLTFGTFYVSTYLGHYHFRMINDRGKKRKY
ncbi:hypothetical protein [Pseudolactococcus hodotermopsidis]|uniref:hypothetical protein n=1 Tax=Pseudolactococcus hodotermopsidis TaxID=2709157 RepID=UPI001552F26E|nr:hypothetical protein [Lactococcus hodotermopsidis]